MNNVVNFICAILLYFFCTQILSMETTAPPDNAASQLTPENSKKELPFQPQIYFLETTPPISIEISAAKKIQSNDDKKNSKKLEGHIRQITRADTTSPKKVFKRKLTSTDKKPSINKISATLAPFVDISKKKLSIEIPIEYSLRHSQLKFIEESNNKKLRPLHKSREAGSHNKLEKTSNRRDSDCETRKQSFLENLSTRLIHEDADLAPKNLKEPHEIKWKQSAEQKIQSQNAEALNYFDARKKMFLDNLSLLLRDADLRDNLIYIYPLFVDDVEFLEALQEYADKEDDLPDHKKWGLKEKTWLLEELLHSFAVQGVFLRYPSTKTVLELETFLNKLEGAHEKIKADHEKTKAEYDKIKGELEKPKIDYGKIKSGHEKNIVIHGKIKNIDNLRHRIWLALDEKNRTTKEKSHLSRRKSGRNIYEELEALVPNDVWHENDLLPENLLYKKRRIVWSNAKYIAQLMTIRDSNLYKAISVQHILSWVKKRTPTTSITKLEEVFHATATFLELLLICEKSETRLSLAEKYVAIADELYELHNFIGLTQIITALKNPAVKRLIKWDQSKVYQKLVWLEAIVSPVKNFHNYKLELNKLINGEHFLPILSDVWRDLNEAFEEKPDSLSRDWLIGLGQHLSTIQQWKRQSSYDITLIKETINFMEEVFFVPEDVLEEFTDLAEPYGDRPIILPPPAEKLIIEWTFAELKAFLLQEKWDGCIKPLLMNQVWSGKALFDLLANNYPDQAGDNRRETRQILVALGCPRDEANSLLMFVQVNMNILH